MARRNRVAVSDFTGDASPASRRSLAVVVRELDDQLDTAIVETKAERAIAAADPDGPKAMVGKGPQIDEAWARDEIDVIRKLAKGSAGYGVVGDYGGELGRSLERHALGTGSAPSSSRAYEPSTGSGHHDAAARVWASLTADQRALLDGMFRPDGAKSAAGKVREHMREGAVLAAREELKAFDPRIDPGLVELDKVTPTQLLALKVGRLHVAMNDAERASVTSEVGKELLEAREMFRARLREVDLNAALEGKAHLADMPRERRPFLIAPAPLAEKERVVDVLACAGVFVLDGVRQPCGVLPLRADPSSWPRCDYCGNPRRM